MMREKDRDAEPCTDYTYICKKYGQQLIELGIQIPPRHYVGGGEGK